MCTTGSACEYHGCPVAACCTFSKNSSASGPVIAATVIYHTLCTTRGMLTCSTVGLFVYNLHVGFEIPGIGWVEPLHTWSLIQPQQICVKILAFKIAFPHVVWRIMQRQQRQLVSSYLQRSLDLLVTTTATVFCWLRKIIQSDEPLGLSHMWKKLA